MPSIRRAPSLPLAPTLAPTLAFVLALTACGDDTSAATTSSGSGGAGQGGSTGDGGGSGTGGDSGATTATASTSTSQTSTTTGGGSFSLEVHTSLEGATLVLSTNLPHHVGPCASLPFADTPCGDADADGLVDAWEELALDRLRPFVVLDEDEDEELVDDPTFALGIVGRVAAVGDLVHVYMMLGYAKDFGSCGFTAHNGDSERVALALAPRAGSDGDVAVAIAYTAAHENTANDHGQVFQEADFGLLTFQTDAATGEPRWAVFASANKHATYASIEICEDASSTPCVEEDCAPDGVDAAAYTRLFPFVNAGEEATPLITDLTAMGFPGDDAWAEQDFCGGLGGDGCSAPVRDKLLVDPF
jgi:hypothetical protein